MSQLDHHLLRAYARTCVGRTNDYAVQRADGGYYRAGALLTYEVLQQHLAGVQTVGSYVISEVGLCRWALYDADSPEHFLALLETQAQLRADGIPAHLELSRRPGHLRVLLASPAPASLVRRWLLPYCPPGVEFYPKQDMVSWEHPGSLVRLPLGVHRLTGQRYPFVEVAANGALVPVASSLMDLLAWLASAPRAHVPASLLCEERDQARHRDTKKDTLPVPLVPAAPRSLVVALPRERTAPATIAQWCRMQDPVAVIGRYVSLNARGLGCCPFGSHHAGGADTRASLWVHPLRGDELACWYCHAGKCGGSLFDFLRLYYGLDARTLWQRIQAGGHL